MRLSVCPSVSLSVCPSEHQHFWLITFSFVEGLHPSNFFSNHWAMGSPNPCLDFNLDHGKWLKK